MTVGPCELLTSHDKRSRNFSEGHSLLEKRVPSVRPGQFQVTPVYEQERQCSFRSNPPSYNSVFDVGGGFVSWAMSEAMI